MVTKLCILAGSVTTIPILAQIQPSTLIGKLAVGSAQFILSTLVVILGFAVFKMFKLWRADVETYRIADAARYERVEKVLSDTAVSQAQLSTSLANHTEAVHRFANVVDKCERKG